MAWDVKCRARVHPLRIIRGGSRWDRQNLSDAPSGVHRLARDPLISPSALAA